MTKIAITYKKSAIGYERSQRRAIESLGLKRLNQTVEHERHSVDTRGCS